MSMEFFLTGNRLSADEWQAIATGLVDDGKLEIYYPPTFLAGNDGNSYMTVEGPGSIRGVTVCHAPTQVEVVFNSFASRLDFRNGMLLLRRAMEQGGGELEDENGTAYSAKEVNLKLAEGLATDYFCFCVNAARDQCRQHGAMEIQGEMCRIALGVEDFPPTTPANIAATEAHLVARVQPYLEAFRAQTMLLNNGARLATWALIPTLIGRVTHVMVNDGHDSVVAYEMLLKILGDRAEVMREGEFTFLPALDAADPDDRILIALIGTMADPAFAAADAEDGGAEEAPDGAASDEEEEEEESFEDFFADVLETPAFIAIAAQMLDGDYTTDTIQACVGFVVEAICQEAPLIKAANHLREQGLPDAIAAVFARLGQEAFDLYAVEDLEAKEVRNRLVAEGMPKEIATAVVKGVIAGLKAAAGEEGDEDEADEAAAPAKAGGKSKKRTFTTKRPSSRSAAGGGQPAVRRMDPAAFSKIVKDLATAISNDALDEAHLVKLAKKHGRELDEMRFSGSVIYEILAAIGELSMSGREITNAAVYKALAEKGLTQEMVAPFLKTLAEG